MENKLNSLQKYLTNGIKISELEKQIEDIETKLSLIGEASDIVEDPATKDALAKEYNALHLKELVLKKQKLVLEGEMLDFEFEEATAE